MKDYCLLKGKTPTDIPEPDEDPISDDDKD